MTENLKWIILNGGGLGAYKKINTASNGYYIELENLNYKEKIYVWEKMIF